MRVHRLIEHVPVGSNRLQALFLSDDLALTASDFELPVPRDIAEVLGKMPGATLLARDLDHDLGGLAHDPLELGPRLGCRMHGISPAPALRSEERSVGKECYRTWRSWWSPHY